MCRFFLLFLCFALFAYPQAPAPPPQPTEIIAITPDTVVATVNGRKFTAGEFEKITQNLLPQQRELAGTNPKAFLEQFAFQEVLSQQAEKLKLDQMPPYRDQLEQSRRQILTQGLLKYQGEAIKVEPAEVRKRYDANLDQYRQANVQVIFISREQYVQNLRDGSSKTVNADEMKAKAEKVAKLAREGKDFVALAKEYSDDRGSAEKDAMLAFPIRANAQEIPQEIRTAIFKAKPGDVLGLFQQESGYYLFRLVKVELPDFDAVQKDIEREMKDAAVRKWLADERAKASATLDHKPFWDTFLAANKAAAEKQQQQQVVPPPPAGGK